ncbi:MAG: nuclear transport factor 2 family protein [bacterium]|nr:nuclear transport factor 2 family protein [bacterium]
MTFRPIRLTTITLGMLMLACASSSNEGGIQADRLAIADAIAQYAYQWDAKNAEGFADLFTEDAIFEVEVSGVRVPDARVEGRPAIYAYAKDSHEGRLAGKQTRHHMTSLVFIALTDDAATTENMVLVTHQSGTDATPQPRASGIYRNTWRKTSQGWKISRRLLLLDRPARR